MAAPLVLSCRCTHILCKSSKIACVSLVQNSLRGQKSYSQNREEDTQKDVARQKFRTFQLRTKAGKFMRKEEKFVQNPIHKRFDVKEDWTAVWPTAKTFNWAYVPLPVRQGFAERSEGTLGEQGIPPWKYPNTELLKIPNFFHLTPKHIVQHCQAIRKYCTRWPDELKTKQQMEEHFPVEVITSDYCFSGPSVRDPRARVVTLKFKLSRLELDEHARDKIVRLLDDRYDAETDTVTLAADRCPLQKQNYEYIQYLMTALFFESWKVEPWESEITPEDFRFYSWNHSSSRQSVLQYLNMCKQKAKDVDGEQGKILSQLPDEITDDTLNSLEQVRHYQQAVEELHSSGENTETLDKYKQSVIKMLTMQQPSSTPP